MSEKKYYCFCSSNCKYETMTKEQILAAIAQAAETGLVYDPDAAVVSKVKERNSGGSVTFWVGTNAQYNALEEKEQNCVYIITDDTSVADFEKAAEEASAAARAAATASAEAKTAAATALAEAKTAKTAATAAADAAGAALPKTGGTMTGTLAMNGGHIQLKKGVNFFDVDDELPDNVPDGTLVFKVVGS